MATFSEIRLSEEQREIFDDVEAKIVNAIRDECDGCPSAGFAPDRLALSAARGRIPQTEQTIGNICVQYSQCPGFDGICHLPTAKPHL